MLFAIICTDRPGSLDLRLASAWQSYTAASAAAVGAAILGMELML